MDKQQPDQELSVKRLAEESKQAKSDTPLLEPEEGSPMDKFNNGMRKILSAPKKQVNKK